MNVYWYRIGPIDWWLGWTTLDEAFKQAIELDKQYCSQSSWVSELAELITASNFVINEARRVDEVPRIVASLPDLCDPSPPVVLAIKVDNNGDIFLFSQKGLKVESYESGFCRMLMVEDVD